MSLSDRRPTADNRLPAAPRRRRPGFTLIELLVVIAIISILVSLILPAVIQVRAAARRTQCRNNLKQLGLALHEYQLRHTSFPPGVVADSDNLRLGRHSGLALLLPFLEHSPIVEQYDFDRPWNDPVNRTACESPVPVLRCPSAGSGVPQHGGFDYGPTDYAFSKGSRAALCLKGVGGGMFDVNSSIRPRDVEDGLSNTFAMGEAASYERLAARAP